LFVLTLLLARPCAAQPARFVKEFHGIQPCKSTLDDVQANARWAKPVAVKELDTTTLQLSFAIAPWRDVQAIVRGDVVRAIDLIPPSEYRPEDLVQPFDLGRLQPAATLPSGADLPAASGETVTYQIAEKAYAVLFVKTADGKAVVERVRLFAPTTGPDLLLPGDGPAQPKPLAGPNDTHRQAVRTAASVLPRRHVSRHPLDDEIARRTWQNYLDKFDYNKLMLTQQDVSAWEARVPQIDEDLNRGELGLFWEAAQRAKVRADQERRLVAQLLRGPVDFRQEEVYHRDGSRIAFAANDADLRERWRLRIKFLLLMHRASGADDFEARVRIWRSLLSSWTDLLEMDDEDVLQYAVDSLARAFDPHSSYMSDKQHQKYLADLQQRLVGVGASLQDQNSYVTVMSLLDGSPAERGGLRAGDRILAVADGDEGLWRNAVGEPLAKTIDRIRGADQTVVRLRILSAGETASKVVRLVRAPIQNSSVQSALLAGPQVGDGRPEKIGYINLTQFYRAATPAGGTPAPSSSGDVRQALENFSQQQAHAVVLDLRSNTGGLLSEVGALAELFAGPGPVMQLRATDGTVSPHNAEGQAAWAGPLILLANERTGGGGEMLLAALMDRGRALVLGATQTEGSGTTRQLWELGRFVRQEPLPKLGVVQITENLAYRINGDSFQQAGVRPHLLLPPQRPTQSVLSYTFARDLPFALKFDRTNPLTFSQNEKYAVSTELRLWLQERSSQRVGKSPELREVDQMWKRLAASDNGNVVPLQEDEFAAWSRAFSGQDDSPLVPGTRSVRFDHQLREALAITLDYLDRMKGP
jgi:carboxyl-terminal processing protease